MSPKPVKIWTAIEVRKAFLDFFKSMGHKIVPSAPIVIKGDPTLMFTNAGMNQFKDYFLGNRKPVDTRIADTQKCLRVSGKHNDLEEVGHDTYHHTMFEMLGNWSFGDYFKKEAIDWAWQLLTDVYALPKDRLYVTVFEGDENDGQPRDQKAHDEWSKWVPEERIINGDRKDNFWEMGATGPCGPSSEIHIDLRSDEEREQVDGRTLVNKDHPEVVEIWNLVFIEFNRKADGSLDSLPEKHVDTGMGFERLCMALQAVRSNYDTDVFKPLIIKIESVTGKNYGASEESDVAIRVIADHVRAVAFAIADGQLPSNTGAGYVIRRILRRAIRYAFSYLAQKEAFIYQLVDVLSEQMGEFFPEITEQRELVRNVIREEEQGFLRTLEQGLTRIDQLISESKTKRVNGAQVFELHDTYGFPPDLTNEIQVLSLMGNNLQLSNGGGDVVLPSAPVYSAGTGIDMAGNVITNTGDIDETDDIIDTTPAGGDVSGVFSNLEVEKIRGNPIGNNVPVLNEVLKWDGASWIPQNDEVNDPDSDPTNEIQVLSLMGNNLQLSNGGGNVALPAGAVYTAGTGIDIVGNVITNTGDTDDTDDIITTTPAGGDVSGVFSGLTVEKLQGNSVSNNAPGVGDVLKWDGSEWKPDADVAGAGYWLPSGSNIYRNSGKVGIGTDNPDFQLNLVSEAPIYGGIHIRGISNSFQATDLRFSKARGSNAGGLQALNPGDQLGEIEFAGYTGTLFKKAAYINAVARDNFNSTAKTGLQFYTHDGNLVKSRLTIDANGNVGIGLGHLNGLAPQARLHLKDKGNIGSGNNVIPENAAILIGSTSSGLAFDKNQIESVGATFYLNHYSDKDLRLVGGGGDVGVGTYPYAKLHVAKKGTIDNPGGSVITNNAALILGTTTFGLAFDDNQVESVGTDFFINNTSDRNVLIAKGGGNVGIGTMTPTARLEIPQKGNINGANVITSNAALLLGSPTVGMAFDVNQIETVGNTLHFNYTSDNNITLAYGGGNVGIGTSVPVARLQIPEKGSINGGGSVTTSNSALLIGGPSYGMAFDNNQIETLGSDLHLNYSSNKKVIIGVGGGKIGLGKDNPTYGVDVEVNNVRFDVGSASDVIVDKSGSSFRFRPSVSETGYVGSNSYPFLAIYGKHYFALTTGHYAAYSDRRIKENIQPLSNSLDIIQKLNSYSYDLKSDFAPDPTNRFNQAGFIAQELEEVLPNLVHEEKESGLKNRWLCRCNSLSGRGY